MNLTVAPRPVSHHDEENRPRHKGYESVIRGEADFAMIPAHNHHERAGRTADLDARATPERKSKNPAITAV